MKYSVTTPTEIHIFGDDIELIKYAQEVYKENESGPSDIHWIPENLPQAKEYLIEYCGELEFEEL